MASVITWSNPPARRRCDATCHDAKSTDCSCICGGKNHGKGLQQAIANTTELAEKILEEAKQSGAKLKFRDPATGKLSAGLQQSFL